MNAPCSLCRTNFDLQESHIVPDFIGKWLRRTSATGYLRIGKAPNRRVQDIHKREMLCRTCEQVLSPIENKFAQNIFYPYMERKTQAFPYEEWLRKFCISLQWKMAMHNKLEDNEYKGLTSELSQKVDACLNIWAKYLLGQSDYPGPSDHHLFFCDATENVGELFYHKNLNWYLMRAIDMDLVSNAKSVTAYVKIPGMIFWSPIHPPTEKGVWKGTWVYEKGTLRPPQIIKSYAFPDFLQDRVKVTMAQFESMSAKQQARTSLLMQKDPIRVMNSESYKIFLADKALRKNK